MFIKNGKKQRLDKTGRKRFRKCKTQLEHNFLEWACFLSQQAAEKAIKAVYQKIGGEAWGHSIKELLKGIEEKIDIPQDLIEKAKYLDRFYIPTRYPNGWPSGIPADYITKEETVNAISYSEKIVQFCKSFLS